MKEVYEMTKEELQREIFRLNDYAVELEEKLERVKELRKTLNNEMLDYLPFDIAEQVQDLFVLMLNESECEDYD